MNDDRVLSALLSSPSTVLIGVAPDGAITMWSAGAARLFGWTEGEVLGQPLSVLAPADRQDELAQRRSALAGDEVPPFETVWLARDGSPVETEMHILAVRDDGGQVLGTVAVHRDLRRAHRAECALTASQDELRVRFAESPVAQARVDLAGRVLAVNGAMEKLLYRTAEELIGQDAIEKFAVDDREELEQALGSLASGAEPYVRQERTLVRADGEPRRVVMTATTIRGEDDALVVAGSLEDITDLREAQERMRSQAERFDALLETMPVVVVTYDREARCTSSRGQSLRQLGMTDGALDGTLLLDAYADVPHVAQAVQATLQGEDASALYEAAERAWKGHFRPVRDEAGEVVGGMNVALDVTELLAAERTVRANEARLTGLLAHASDVVLVVDVAGRIIYVSPAVRARLGYDERELFWRTAIEVFNHPDDRRSIVSAWRSALESPGASASVECRVRHADGSWRWADHVLTNLLDDPAVGGIVVNVRETTERRAADEELRRLALHDRLTGLANRALLLDRTSQALSWEKRAETRTGLIVLDVTNLRGINEAVGHDGGDEVLRAVAERLVEAAREVDSVARIGGDEFTVLIEDVASAEDLRTRAASFADAAAGPVPVGEAVVEVRLRAGSALTPAQDAGALLAAAERAVHRTGDGPRLVVAVPTDGKDATAVAELRRALARDELRLHFQPVVDLVTGEVAGVESLVRWQHPERGLLGPAEFVPLAETSGLIVELGEWVLRRACSQAAAWQAAGRTWGVGVNLSPRQMVGADFVRSVRETMRATGARPDLLVLEVTESALMDDPQAPEVLQALRDLGVRLALDDFGTGYSSLTYLKRFPIDVIKVDRSFVSGLGRDRDDEAIVASVVSLAHSIGKLVVAEGVETAGQLAALRELGVEQGQGFLWSPALPADELGAWQAQRQVQVVSAAPIAATPVDAAPLPADGDEQRVLELHGQGASLHTIAAALNAEGKRTAEGRRWTTTTVARVVAAAVRRS